MQTQNWIKLSCWWIKKKPRILSTEIESYQEIWNIKKTKQKKVKIFQNIVAIFKFNSILFLFLYVGLQGFVVVAYLFRVVFSTRIFRNLDSGIEWVLRCKAIELESLRCIVSCLERVVVLRLASIRIIFFGDTVFQGKFEHIYYVGPIKKFGGGGSVIRNN